MKQSMGNTGVGAAAALSPAAGSNTATTDGQIERTAQYISTRDGVQLYYRDWGPRNGPVVTFSHGWPLSSDSWESQMIFLADKGYRVVAHDRRGHGRSSQPWEGNDMDHYADDLAAVIEALDLRDVTLVGFSTGGGEVARYIGRHGTARVKKAVLVGAVAPIMLNASQGWIYTFWVQGMQGGHKNTFDSIKAFSETDFRADLAKFNVPTLIVHGDDDQIVPVDNSARAAHSMIKGSKLILYKGGPHGITDTHKDRLNQDLLSFLRE
jgi:non-heme chloroperoxidase